MSSTSSAARDRELCFFTATELVRHFRSRELSPVEVTSAVLRRIERVGPSLNAFVLVDAEAALASARSAEERYFRGEPLSELDGVTVSLKDLLLARGWPTRRGSLTTSDAGPWDEDSPAAARLREAGAVLLGKTTTTEFGLKGTSDSPLTGITRNPWNLEHSPGGSSMGAVAAVAAGLGALAVGTDGGGSIRVPAAFAGVVGLKPTFGRVPTYPSAVLGAPPHVGPIARSVKDATALLTILAGDDERDPYRLPPPDRAFHAEAGSLRGLRIGYGAELFPAQLSDELSAAFARAVELLADAGAELSALDERMESPSPILTTLFQARAAFTVKDLSEEQRAQLDPAIAAAAREGEALGLLDYLGAEAARTALAQRLTALHQRFDLLLTPSTGELAPPLDAPPSANRAPFTGAFSLTRQPALSLPVGVSESGLPIGVQLVGRHFDETQVLRAAAALEVRLRPAAPPL